MAKRPILLFVLIPIVLLILVGLFFLPPIHDRLIWKIDETSLRIGYILHPPAKAVFIPTQKSLAPPQVTTLATIAASTPTSRLVYRTGSNQ